MKYLAITAVLVLILAGASFAGNVTMTEVLTGGNLTLTMPSDFSLNSITLGGYSLQGPSAWRYYYVEDSRGTGAGWNLGFQIGQFVTAGTPQRTIATDKFKMDIPSDYITLNYGQSINGANGPKSLITSYTAIADTEVKGVTSAVNYGMGKYSINARHLLYFDAYVYAGTYTATLTATLNNVP